MEIEQIREGNGGYSAVSQLIIDLGSGDRIEDLVIGYGPTAAQAVISSIDQFVGGIVAPIAALAKKDFDSDKWGCSFTNFELPGQGSNVGWNMVLGQVISNDAGGELYSLANQHPPMFNLFTEIAQHVLNRADRQPHWIKIFLCRYQDGLDGEVRIDNQLHEKAYQTLRNFKWPNDQPFIWFRQFGFLEPANATGERWFGVPRATEPALPETGGFFSGFLKARR
jgi:hypothetical protein